MAPARARPSWRSPWRTTDTSTCAVEQLVAAGARSPERTSCAAELHEWVTRELPRVTRPLKHGGNHRYLFPLTPQVRRHMYGPWLPYPKISP